MRPTSLALHKIHFLSSLIPVSCGVREKWASSRNTISTSTSKACLTTILSQSPLLLPLADQGETLSKENGGTRESQECWLDGW